MGTTRQLSIYKLFRRGWVKVGGSGAVGAGTRATLGNVRGGTVSGANGGVERSETVPAPSCPGPPQPAKSRPYPFIWVSKTLMG